MEFAKDEEFVADFVRRTKENIKCGCHPYEITQRINSLVGLLILPKERYYDHIDDSMISPKLLAALMQGIKIPNNVSKLDLKSIVRRMRNAIAHFHIKCKADKYTHLIDHIVFEDFNSGNTSKNPDF